MMRVFRAGAVALCVLLCAPPARAAEVDLGVTPLLTFGTHQDSRTQTHVPSLPLPLVTIGIHLKRFEIAAEGVPPIGPVPYRTHSYVDSQSTLLSYAQAVLRYRVTRYLWVGVGETLYNQRTTYGKTTVYDGAIYQNGIPVAPMTITSVDTQTDASRVPGMRLELRTQVPLGASQWIAADLAVTPSMHAIVRTTARTEMHILTPAPIGSPRPYAWSFESPETGSQIDAGITAGRRFGAYTLLYGVRYLNYVAHFNYGGRLADRNTLILPFIGFERAFGR